MFLLLCSAMRVAAQEFVNLTAPEVRIGQSLPVYYHEFPLMGAFADSTYSVSIEYPEFIDMSEADVERYHAISSEELPALPVVEQFVGVSRRQGRLCVSLVPLAFREGKYQKLVSFRLKVEASKLSKDASRAAGLTRADDASRESEGYAAHSVLASGKWAKISIPSTGVYQLTDGLVRQAGFSSLSRVKIYGYGGALQPEVLTADYLTETDDLKEVPTCIVNGRRLFHGVGPVGWESATSTVRTRNPYSDVGCYFLTESDDEPLLVDSAAFVSSFYPAPDDYHSLVEPEEYAWYHSGRNFFESTPIPADGYRSYELDAHSTDGRLYVAISYDAIGVVSVMLNDSLLGTVNITNTLKKTDNAAERVQMFNVQGLLSEHNTVKLRHTKGEGTMRLDYIDLQMATAAPAPNLVADAFPTPQFVYRITNQDHHADEAADMVIIIPTSQKVLSQALRLKQLHETFDSLRVNIVPADELYNEFSSGTPDATAYKRYLKMLYDRAETEADMPRYLLLFGDGAYDNRMLTSNFSQLDPADFLLCYESENSLSETACYVCDDYFGLLDDGEGGDLVKSDKVDVGVGRFPARTIDEAKVLVDKAYSYRLNEHPGSWQNIICFMGDDGNANMHMNDAETVSSQVSEQWPAYHIKKIYWDAYQRTSSTTGYAYPDVSRLIRQQMREGALLMNYTGHGAANTLSHEYVVGLDDFKASTSLRLPMWFTASCDVAPFDGHEENIGEQAMFNPNGGAIAFLGTTRTVYALHNRSMNRSFMKHILSLTDGRRNTIGDAVRMAKNDQVKGISTQTQAGINKRHFALLGDPALQLAFPVETVVVDSINGQAVDRQTPHLIAGDTATVKGHIKDCDHFQGVVTLTVKDAEEVIVCRLNPQAQDEMPKSPLVYRDRPGTLFEGSDSVRSGTFTITFAVPKDISSSDDYGQMLLYAVDDTRQVTAHGFNEHFTMGSAEDYENAGEGPIIHAWLDAPDFVDGAVTAAAPTFHADLYDEDGVNVSGSGIGHDLELVVDGLMRYTFNLNSYFHYDFGDYRSGSLDFTLPTLAEGTHELSFRAWDVLNHSSEFRTTFVVGTAGSSSGISDVLTDADTAEAYDLQGRRLQQGSSQRSTLILYRTLSGKMKKKLMKGNK